VNPTGGGGGPIERISAVTLATEDMARAARFYESVGFECLYGGPGSDFTSYRVGDGFLNLQLDRGAGRQPVWGRVIFWVDDVDLQYARVVDAGYDPEAPPADAPWGERYFHVRDPDGHELSFARPLVR
jgi:catechol 2,3-dioxygenase-like lactoylglutathione lyase family enzyme